MKIEILDYEGNTTVYLNPIVFSILNDGTVTLIDSDKCMEEIPKTRIKRITIFEER